MSSPKSISYPGTDGSQIKLLKVTTQRTLRKIWQCSQAQRCQISLKMALQLRNLPCEIKGYKGGIFLSSQLHHTYLKKKKKTQNSPNKTKSISIQKINKAISIFKMVKINCKGELHDFFHIPLHFLSPLTFLIGTKSKNKQKDFTKFRFFFFLNAGLLQLQQKIEKPNLFTCKGYGRWRVTRAY